MNYEWEEVQPEEKEYDEIIWDFDKNDEIICKILKVESDKGKYKSNLYTAKKRNGEIVKIWGSTVLDSRLANMGKDDIIRITYLGKVPTDKGNPYRDFKVFKAKPAQTPDLPNAPKGGKIPIIEEGDYPVRQEKPTAREPLPQEEGEAGRDYDF